MDATSCLGGQLLLLSWLLSVRAASLGVQRGKMRNPEHTEMSLCREQVQCLCTAWCSARLGLICSPDVPSGDKGGDPKIHPQLQSKLGMTGKGSAKGTAEASAARARWGCGIKYCPSKFQFPQNPWDLQGHLQPSLHKIDFCLQLP